MKISLILSVAFTLVRLRFCGEESVDAAATPRKRNQKENQSDGSRAGTERHYHGIVASISSSEENT